MIIQPERPDALFALGPQSLSQKLQKNN